MDAQGRGDLRWLLIAAMLWAMPAHAKDLLIIAHRGASGERPEHTIAAYELAIEQGADFIEPDLVMTKDGVLVARHENEISETTDIAARMEFAARRTTKTIDGATVSGWFTEDFTLAELKTLRARERLPQLRGTAYDGRFEIATFDEIVALAKARGVGVYPEIKHGQYFARIGLCMEKPLLAALAKVGWTKKTHPVFIQSFEVGNLKRLRGETKLRLIQLMSDSGGPADRAGVNYAEMATPNGLKAVARYADGVGAAKALASEALVRAAHAAGLTVHVWTFRAENFFLAPEFRQGSDVTAHGDMAGEVRAFASLGIDGLFSDFPELAKRATAAPR